MHDETHPANNSLIAGSPSERVERSKKFGPAGRCLDDRKQDGRHSVASAPSLRGLSALPCSLSLAGLFQYLLNRHHVIITCGNRTYSPLPEPHIKPTGRAVGMVQVEGDFCVKQVVKSSSRLRPTRRLPFA